MDSVFRNTVNHVTLILLNHFNNQHCYYKDLNILRSLPAEAGVNCIFVSFCLISHLIGVNKEWGPLYKLWNVESWYWSLCLEGWSLHEIVSFTAGENRPNLESRTQEQAVLFGRWFRKHVVGRLGREKGKEGAANEHMPSHGSLAGTSFLEFWETMQNSSLKAIPPRGEGAEALYQPSVVVSKCFQPGGKTRPAVCWGGVLSEADPETRIRAQLSIWELMEKISVGGRDKKQGSWGLS